MEAGGRHVGWGQTRRVGGLVATGVAIVLLVACGSGAAGASGSTAAAGRRLAPAHLAAVTGADWPVYGADPQHSMAAPASGITAANVGSLTVRKVRLPGVVDAEAIELHAVRVRGRARDVVFATSIAGQTWAIDAATGARLWSFRPAGPSDTVTDATPVADPSRRYLYTASPNGVIHKLSVATGRQVWARAITYDYHHEKIASSLTVNGRYVIAVTGGYYGDAPPYDGHVAAIDRSSGRLAHVWNTECSARHQLLHAASCPSVPSFGGNAIWARAGAVIEPGGGRMLLTTGNGPFDGHSNWGDSVLELTGSATRLLHNWTPADQASLERTDSDLGSTDPALLPRYHGYRLAVQGGKDGKFRLLDLGRLDGTRGAAGPRTGGELQTVPAPGGDLVYTTPAVWKDAGRIWVFVTTDSGTAGYQLTGRGHGRLHRVWSDGDASTSPVVSGGLLYDYDESTGQLIIRAARTGAALRRLPLATGHWNSPIVVGGRIIEPTGDYHQPGPSTLYIFHLPGR